MIRKALPADLDAVEALAARHAPEDGPRFVAVWKAFLEDPKVCFLLAESEGRICGYVLGFMQNADYDSWKVCWVEDLLVDESQRRKGAGKELMAGIQAWALSENCPQMALATRRAAEFYKALGYKDSATLFTKRL